MSDTHMPGRARELPPACRALIDGCDLLVHAGDVSDEGTLRMLRGLGVPLAAVHGNVDRPEVVRMLPETLDLAPPGGPRISVVHDAGPEKGRLGRLRRRFPDAEVVVFGHSHIPWRGEAERFLAVNPGSPTDPRRQPRPTMADLVVDEGRPAVRFWAVDGVEPEPLPGSLVRTVR